MTLSYNDKLAPDEQVIMEEKIAATLFDYPWGDGNGEPEFPSEEECAQLGRDILLMVLAKFRPDLVEEE